MKCASRLKTVGASLLVLTLLYCAAVHKNLQAQVAGGTISGTVVDISGRTIPNASISITNTATGINRTVTTNSDGFYTVPNLLPGTYDLKFTATGFKSEVRSGIGLTVGASVSIDLTMKVGTTTETVLVQTEAPAVQLSSSDISAVVNATTVRELPLNGRSWTDLASLQPGVDTIHTQPDFSAGTDRGNRGFGQQLTISGARPQQNNYRLDGVSLNDYSNGAPGSVLGGALGVDAIQEFSVLTSNYSAEYGKTSGGVVNAITRSGTNQFHGSAYEFIRNSKLDARNYFDGSTIPPFKRNQFGGAIGGPIIKNRTFFFADYEGIRQAKGISTLTFVPSPAVRNGLLCSTPPADGSCFTYQLQPTANTNANGVDLNAAKYLVFYHLPDPGTIFGNGDLGTYTFAGNQIVNENFLTTRIDHKFSDKDSIYGTYLFDRTPYSSPDGLNNVEFDTKTTRQIFVAEETHSFSPRFVNSVRLGWNHEPVDNNKSVTAINPAAADLSLGSFPGRHAAQVLMNGGASDFTGGIGGSPTYLYKWNSAQVYDDAFYTLSTHNIRFGVAVERMMLNELADTDPNGIWHFGAYTAPDPNDPTKEISTFLQNIPTKFQGGEASTLSPRNLRQTIFGAYIQDDWRVRPNLTLNLGLRYEMSTVPTETAGKIANLRNIGDLQAVCGKVIASTPQYCGSKGPFFNNPTLRNFEPRVGFAWDPFRNGKTAVRGGAGLFDVLPLIYQFILLTNQAAPFFTYISANSPGQGTFFTNPPLNAQPRSTFVQSNPTRTYVGQWNLNIQQQITPTIAAMVAYVGSRGVHQPFRADEINLVKPTKVAPYGYFFPQVDVVGNIWDPANGCTQTDPNAAVGDPGPPICNPPNPINTNYSSIRAMIYEGRSYYNALEVQLAKRMSRGIQLQGTFTWSKSIDTGSATIAGDSFGNSISSLHWYDFGLNRGPSDFNVGRTFVMNGTWEIPTPKGASALTQHALGGWELGLIFTASDGVPVTPTWGTGSDPANTLSSDDWAFPTRLGGSGCKTLTHPGNPNNYIKTECFAVPTVPNSAVWNQYCDPAPVSLGGPLPAGDLRCFNLRGNAGRNIIIGPGVTEMDFSMFKNNYIKRISENFNIQFRAELFNILNHANFAPPATPNNTDIFDGTGTLSQVAGQLTKTTTTAREIQFAIKIIF